MPFPKGCWIVRIRKGTKKSVNKVNRANKARRISRSSNPWRYAQHIPDDNALNNWAMSTLILVSLWLCGYFFYYFSCGCLQFSTTTAKSLVPSKCLPLTEYKASNLLRFGLGPETFCHWGNSVSLDFSLQTALYYW